MRKLGNPFGKSIITWGLFPMLFIAICNCAPYRYLSIETLNPADITFPVDMRRVLVVNNALPQNEVPFESTKHKLIEPLTISADSAAYDFCRTLGETLADFRGFDEVRLLEGSLRIDQSLLTAPKLTRDDVDLLCNEHESDIVISLDLLLFRVEEYANIIFGYQTQEYLNVETSGVLRVYAQGRETPMTTILLADTIIFDIWFDQNGEDIWDFLSSDNQTNLLRESAIYLAYKARKHFIPYWDEDIRWYYTSFETRWKEATAYAEAEKWDMALEIWREIYEQTSSWKKQARLCSNIALGLEMTGNFEQALQYAKKSNQLMQDHQRDDDKQEVYVNVLTNRITEEQKLRLQHLP